MNSKVIKLADLDLFQVNPEYREIAVAEDEIESLIQSMSSNLGETVTVSEMEENCGVKCVSSDGRSILLYPSLQINGVDQASKDAAGKSIGDTFTTVIRGEELSLTVEKIMVNRPLPLDDGLAKASGIEGVDTFDQLMAHLKDSQIEKKREEKVRLLFSEYMQYLLDESEVEIDEEESTQWATAEAKRVYEEELSFGIDLRFTEEGDMISLEEALDRLAAELQTQFKMNLIQDEFGGDACMFETLTTKAREALS